MSTTTETTSESSNESKPGSVTPSSATSASSATTANADAQANAFDAESLELSFGLPPGSLKDVKDEKSALEAVRSFTDKILTAGIGFAGAATTETKVETPPAKVETPPAKAAAAATVANPEFDALRAELREVKTMLSQQAKVQTKNEAAEIERRISDKMDTWASPTYGVKGNRNYKQTQAVQQFQNELLPHFLAGRNAAGFQNDPKSLEAYMEQLRVHHDEHYKPAKKDGDKSTALGTPGANKGVSGAAGANAPQNIHQALIGNRS